jgi:hypothetical protein
MKKLLVLLSACLGFLLVSCEPLLSTSVEEFDDAQLERMRQAWIGLDIQNYSFTAWYSVGAGGSSQSVRHVIKNGSPAPGLDDPIGTIPDIYGKVKQMADEYRRKVDNDNGNDITDARINFEYNEYHIPTRWSYSLFYHSKGAWVHSSETRIENIQLTQFDRSLFERERQAWIDLGIQNYQFVHEYNASLNTVVQGRLVTRAGREDHYTIPEVYDLIEQLAEEGLASSGSNQAVMASLEVIYDTNYHFPVTWEYSPRHSPSSWRGLKISGFQPITGTPSLAFDAVKFNTERTAWDNQGPLAYNLSRIFRYADNPVVWWTYEGKITSEGKHGEYYRGSPEFWEIAEQPPFRTEISYTVPEFYKYIADLVAAGCPPDEIYYDSAHNPGWVRFNQWPSAGGVAVTVSTGFFSD